jgi:hypothetical protein
MAGSVKGVYLESVLGCRRRAPVAKAEARANASRLERELDDGTP